MNGRQLAVKVFTGIVLYFCLAVYSSNISVQTYAFSSLLKTKARKGTSTFYEKAGLQMGIQLYLSSLYKVGGNGSTNILA